MSEVKLKHWLYLHLQWICPSCQCINYRVVETGEKFGNDMCSRCYKRFTVYSKFSETEDTKITYTEEGIE